MNPENREQIALEALNARLESFGIDTSTWGTGEAKTLRNLHEEIAQGETALVESAGKLLRRVTGSAADVYYSAPDGTKYRLKEEKQVFKDGRERTRTSQLAVSEKFKPGEDPRAAIIRGIEEELGVSGALEPEDIGTETEIKDSQSYPGLETEYIRHEFKVELSEDQFNPNGYVEVQSGKSTYFVWEKV